MYFSTVKKQRTEAAMAFPLVFYCLGLSCAHIICLHQVHAYFPQCLPYLHVYFPLLILCTLFIYFLTHWVQLVLAICILVESHVQDWSMDSLYEGPLSLKKTDYSSLSSHQLPIAPRVWVVHWEALPHPCWVSVFEM